ncbi:MAG: hypothetical protein QM713_07280 [Arachnia sp.]
MTITAPPTAPARGGIGERKDYHALNAQLNLFAPDGSIQFGKDREAAGAYLAQQVEPNTMRFGSVWERLEWLIEHYYYEEGFLRAYDSDFAGFIVVGVTAATLRLKALFLR